MLAPASRAYPMAAWSCPGTLCFISTHQRCRGTISYRTSGMVLPSLTNEIS